jgi:hypothetical protein
MWYFLKKHLLRGLFKLWSGPWFPNVYTMIHSAYLPRALYVAAELRIPDILQKRPQTIRELAELTQTDEQSLSKIMRLLAAYDVFSQDEDGRYHLARLGKSMVGDHPESALWWVLSLGDELFESSRCMLDSVRTGRTGFELAHGVPLWTWYPEHAAKHDIFIKGMNGFSRAHCRAILGGFDFSRFRRIVDVGGGGGLLMSEILRTAPQTRGVVFDQPRTIEETRLRIKELSLADRCECIGGDFFAGLPADGDAYIFKHVLRDWDDGSVLELLRNCRDAIADDGALLIIDGIVDPRDSTDRMLKLIDVQLMIDAGGGLRTQSEFERLLAMSGFALVTIHYTTSLDAHILEARPVPIPERTAEEMEPAAMASEPSGKL